MTWLAVPLYAHAQGLSNAEIGILFAAPVLAQAPLNLVGGAYTDRIGGRRIMLASRHASQNPRGTPSHGGVPPPPSPTNHCLHDDVRLPVGPAFLPHDVVLSAAPGGIRARRRGIGNPSWPACSGIDPGEPALGTLRA